MAGPVKSPGQFLVVMILLLTFLFGHGQGNSFLKKSAYLSSYLSICRVLIERFSFSDHMLWFDEAGVTDVERVDT